MSLFDLLFLALALTAVVALLAAGAAAVLGRSDRAGRILRRLALGAGLYMAIVIAASVVLPRRVIPRGAEECFDDWCVGVAGVQRSSAAEGRTTYDVDLRLHSRARGVSQRERNLRVYMTDASGSRYEPVVQDAETPFDVLLSPGDTVIVRRRFTVSAGVRQPGLVITHQGGFPIGWLIIGYDAWFREPLIVPLN